MGGGCVLGIDVGTTGVKAALLGPRCRVLATAWRPVTLEAPRPGWAEEDPAQWWRGVREVAAECLAMSGTESRQVAAVGTSGMVPALVLLDEGLRVLRPSIQQNDARSHQEIERLRSLLDEAEVSRRTGGTVNQQTLGPKLAWLAGHEPGVWRGTRYLLGSYDFVNLMLTGEVAVERNWALESGLYDVTQDDWYGDVLGACGVDRSLLPRVVRPTDVVGEVTARAAAALTGLAEGTPVVPTRGCSSTTTTSRGCASSTGVWPRAAASSSGSPG